MERLRDILALGDSILKGVQVDMATWRYVVRNEMGLPALERDLGLRIRNESHFGATCRKGGRLLDRLLGRGAAWDAVVMDFGGNDCDMRWAEIAADPAGEHLPHLPPEEFLERYRAMVRAVRAGGAEPILTTLPPLDARRFFAWWCRDLDRGAVARWLGDVSRIYEHQAHYSRLVEELARQEGAALVDLRGAFLRAGNWERLICEDGTHPNGAGQAVIGESFREFAERRRGRMGRTA